MGSDRQDCQECVCGQAEALPESNTFDIKVPQIATGSLEGRKGESICRNCELWQRKVADTCGGGHAEALPVSNASCIKGPAITVVPPQGGKRRRANKDEIWIYDAVKKNLDSWILCAMFEGIECLCISQGEETHQPLHQLQQLRRRRQQHKRQHRWCHPFKHLRPCSKHTSTIGLCLIHKYPHAVSGSALQTRKFLQTLKNRKHTRKKRILVFSLRSTRIHWVSFANLHVLQSIRDHVVGTRIQEDISFG